MNIVLQGVTVTNWSKDPLLKLDATQRRKLEDSITASRRMTSDSLTLLRDYRRQPHGEVVIADRWPKPHPAGEPVRLDACAKYFGVVKGSATFDADLDTIIARLATTDAASMLPSGSWWATFTTWTTSGMASAMPGRT